METSDVTDVPPKNIYQRMHAVMQDISYVQKSDKKVNDQYRFVTHDAVTAKVRESLVKHGIVALTDIFDHGQDGNRTVADVSVSFVNVDQPDDRITVRAFGYGIDPQDKGPGKAVSYAVKYAFLKAFALETGDDPERDSIDHKPEQKALPRAITATQAGPDAFEALDPDAQQIAREWAMEAMALVREGKAAEANQFLHEKCGTTESQLAVWSQIDQTSKSAMQKARLPAAKPAAAKATVQLAPGTKRVASLATQA